MLFGRRKKEEIHKGDVMFAKGIYLKEPVMNNGNNVLNCFLRGLILFLLTFGSLGGFLSAFSISYNYIMVIVTYLVLAMFFAWLYSLPKFFFRDVGYLAFFAVFLFSIMRLRIYANSGLYEVVNALMEAAQSFFELSGVRQYEVTIDNQYLTVAIVAIFIGLIYIIVLNIWLSSRMSVFWTAVFTFPLLLIPLYMKMIPDAIYIISLVTGYVAVLVFKGNGHFLSVSKNSAFEVKGFRKNRIQYTQDGTAFRQILMRAFVITFSVVICATTVFPKSSFEGMFKKDWLREHTSETIGNFVLLGFSGLYNRYASTGGMSGGKLGGVSNVTPDYQPDLIVTFAPYTNEAVYLKAYTGGRYGDNQWEDIYREEEGNNEGVAVEGYVDPNSVSEDLQKKNLALFEGETMKEQMLALQKQQRCGEGYVGYGKMDIKNVGANISYLYYPYYTDFGNYDQYSNYGLMRSINGLGMQATKTYIYYPKVAYEASLGEVTPDEIDTSAIDRMYMEVPEKNKDVIQAECDVIGLHTDMTENEIIEAVRAYFAANIPYTLKPGATPRGEDFVNYFLTKNRKGYCAHFATAATLIFREMGIPARYVEGYAFGLETALASDERFDRKYFDYYFGYSTIGESTVLDVEVTDAMAHAWVEIYIEGFGWKVVEVTPGSNEATDEDDFWEAFTSMLGDSSVTGDLNTDEVFGELNIEQYSWLIYVVLAVFALVVFGALCRIGIRKGVRYYRCHFGERVVVVIAYYADLCDVIRACNDDFNACKSHREQLEYINGNFYMDIDVIEYSSKLEQISFSQHALKEEELTQLLAILKEIRRAIWRNITLQQRLRLMRR